MRPQRSCHKPHGTTARYTAGCSCFECCEAWREYQADRKASGPKTVDGDLARARIAELRAQGFPRRAIAESAGLAYRTLRAIECGESKRVRIETLDALLGCTGYPGEGTALVPADRTLALIERLHTRMSLTRIAYELGMTRRSLPGTRPQQRVMTRTAHKVEALARKHGLVTHVDRERFEMLRGEGLPTEIIADILGCAVRTVDRLEASA